MAIKGEKAVTEFIFLGSRITVDGDCSHEIKRFLLPEVKLWQTQRIKKQRHRFVNKGPYSQSYVYSSSHVWMWELDHKEGWVAKNLCFQIVVLEKTLETPLNYKEVKLVIPKGNQCWMFIGGTAAETEAPILWPPDVKSPLIGKDPDAGKDWRWEEKRVAEDEMVR